ncbi:MAG: acyl carrier protein [Desulfuromonas sp.]|nr:MAG: acyl carrier protein [Desulfuromonas sp.]
MNEQEMIDLINNALAEEFELEPDDMTAEANLYEDLGLDSLDAVDMVVVLEQAFGFKIREDQAVREIRTLGDIYRFVAGKLQDQAEN